VSTAEASLIVAGVAALGSIGAVVVGFRRLRLERELADRRDARNILGDAARELWRLKQAMRDQYGPMTDGLRTGNPVPEYGTRISSLEERRDAVEGELDVIRIRFANDRAVVATYLEAWKAVKGLLSIYMSDIGGPGSADAVRDAHAISETFDTARDRFLAAAERSVGAKLDE